jgi:hypothetical protein
VQFTQDLVRRAITLRELAFALQAHTKIWRLGERVVRPLHARRALELSGGTRLSMRLHFESLLGRFYRGEESTDDDSDLPLVARARMRKAEAIASGEDEDEGDADGDSDADQPEQQQANPSKDDQAHEAAMRRRSLYHRAIYSPFAYAPDSVVTWSARSPVRRLRTRHDARAARSPSSPMSLIG